ncbi:MAG: hypothetical protein PHF56_19190 [Desulfuromonadaceae bacterium]|jgi:hypothetical protein|nr:hypothetical protein [Desulfuromonadaceae bacterium]
MNLGCGLITEEWPSLSDSHTGNAADINIPVDIFFSQNLAPSIVVCSNCSATENDSVAFNNGEWIPYYWDDDLSIERGPLCPSCVEIFGIHFVFDAQTGEYVKGVVK